MLDFVQPSTDKCQFFRPSFAFGIFRLSRINKKCSILFDPVQICINFLDQVLLLVYSDFLDSTKKSSIMFNPVQICFNFLDQVLVLVYFDFRDSTKECYILVNPVHICFTFLPNFGVFRLSRPNKKCSILFDSVQICFAFSTKYWYIPTFSTQQKMFDFVPPSSDMFRLSRPSFAFGVFRLSRLNKGVFDFFRLSSNMFRVFYQILVYSDFLDPTKNVRFCSTQF